jgi:hypothetical protein
MCGKHNHPSLPREPKAMCGEGSGGGNILTISSSLVVVHPHQPPPSRRRLFDAAPNKPLIKEEAF